MATLQELSPINHVTADDLLALFIYGDRDEVVPMLAVANIR